MALTDEQYKQVFRYAGGDMDAQEQKVFEAALLANKELADEVEFYKQLQTLGESVAQKTTNSALFLTAEKKSEEEKVVEMISRARTNWERDHEPAFKLKHGVTAIPAKNFQQEEFEKLGEDEQQPMATDKKTIVPLYGEGQVKRKKIWKWLAAAGLIGFISLGVFWWNSQDIKDDSIVVANTKENKPAVIDNKTKDDTSKNIIPHKPVLTQENASSKTITEHNKKDVAKQDKTRRSNQTYNIDAEKQLALFAINFKPDAAPSDFDSRLRKAFANYNDSNYNNAILDFEKSETRVKRGESVTYAKNGVDKNKELTKFYAAYYKAQSYLAIDSAAKAVPYFKTAMDTSPDNFWKSKAEWYLALAYLKTGNLKEAEGLLKQLANNNKAAEYKQKAMNLMKQLSLANVK